MSGYLNMCMCFVSLFKYVHVSAAWDRIIGGVMGFFSML